MDATNSNIENNYQLKNLKAKRSKKKSKNLLLFFLLLPAILFITLFILYPVLNTVIYSVYKWNGTGPMVKFRGVGNFIKLFTDDPIFWSAFKNNIIIVLFSLFVQLPIALGLAIILNKGKKRSTIFFRTLFFLPFILSEIITGVIWKFIYEPNIGLMRQLQLFFSPDNPYNGWLASSDTVMYAILFVIFWKYFGFHMIIYIAGLQSIPEELYEAAEIDGANRWQVTWNITIPLLRRAIQMSVFFCFIGSFQIFDVIWALNEGGPVNSSHSMVTYLYKNVSKNRLGYGSSIAILAFFICLTFNLFYQKTLRKKEGE